MEKAVTLIQYIVLLFALNVIALAFKNSTFTIRVNTYRRPDLLNEFIMHYSGSPEVNEIQVIWSDQSSVPPISTWIGNSKVKFEVHKSNSLSNRFRPLIPIKTEAILSLDDDLIIPWHVLKYTFSVWRSNQNALVGFSPRIYAFDTETGLSRYLRWQHTWWNGFYSIMLTKAAFINKKYLYEYDKVIPKAFLNHIDNNRNCEDLAMAYTVATLASVPPVWVKGEVAEGATSGISSGTDHFSERGVCLDVLKAQTGLHSCVLWSQLLGHQKVIPMSLIFDYFSFWADTKF